MQGCVDLHRWLISLFRITHSDFTGIAGRAVSCDDAFQMGSSCYKVHKNERVNWFTAVNRCLANNASLAVFSDNEHVRLYFPSSVLSEQAWIGLVKSLWTWPSLSKCCLSSRRFCFHYHAMLCCSVMFCSVLQSSSIRGLATPWTYFLYLSLSSAILIDSSMVSPVHVLMLSIQAVRGLPRLRAPGIVPCIISFSRQLPCFLVVWP